MYVLASHYHCSKRKTDTPTVIQKEGSTVSRKKHHPKKLHDTKIGRTLRHYMLPCQTANRHFLHFSKEGGGFGGGNGGGERSCYTMYTIFRIQCWPYYIEAMLVISDRTINFHKQSSVSGVHYLYYPPTNFPVMLKMKRRKR